MPSIFLRSAILVLIFTSTSALAANEQLQMLNRGKHGMMAFEPTFLKVAPDDTVTFLPTDIAHNTRSVFSPANGASWNGNMREEVTVMLEEEGVFVYQCDLHLALGIVGVFQVGKAGNLENTGKQALTMRGLIAVNKARLEQYPDQVK
ncbi:plastocyanin/azurin family copper-binding protein [uncultured Microbulbifer sp.]|uniref:plastocyanin/azurin family copper-binding protein n=1 Tax=uncultured Microbulbifer sp. TaxID=348147 RepID=UPI002635CB24|nr:plastocyanin/azurin family copper-binding protein [uncultured Microbulbifer sp.]